MSASFKTRDSPGVPVFPDPPLLCDCDPFLDMPSLSPGPSLHGEIFRLGMVCDDGRGGLLGNHLHRLGESDTDLPGTEQVEHGAVGLQIRAGGVAGTVAGALGL